MNPERAEPVLELIFEELEPKPGELMIKRGIFEDTKNGYLGKEKMRKACLQSFGEWLEERGDAHLASGLHPKIAEGLGLTEKLTRKERKQRRKQK